MNMRYANFFIPFFLLLILSLSQCGVKQNNALCLSENSGGSIRLFENKIDSKLSKHDRALFSTIAKRFGFEGSSAPKIFYFDDSKDLRENAIAFPKNCSGRIISRYGESKYGYIGIGKNFADRLAPTKDSQQYLNYAYPFVIAHEMTHIVQANWNRFFMPNTAKFPNNIKFEDMGNVPDLYKELNADYGGGLFCSIYLSRLWKKTKEEDSKEENRMKYKKLYDKIVKSVRDYICTIGAKDRDSQNTHGTCEERMTVFMEGLHKYKEDQYGSIISEIEYHLYKLNK